MQQSQLNAVCYKNYLEWIPFENFKKITYISRGGFSKFIQPNGLKDALYIGILKIKNGKEFLNEKLQVYCDYGDSIKRLCRMVIPEGCQLYELGESEDPSLSVFLPFTYECKNLEDDSSQEILRNLISKLKAVSSPFQSVEMKHQNRNTWPNGHGPVDFAIDLLQTAKTVGVIERKANEMEEGDAFTGKTFGIITDAKVWYFMECSYNRGKPSFKLSELYANCKD
ncbi:hypothetical protein RhiirA5_417811 [Rhizophagus irregularis]|uniref:Crinkler family protein n=1 Tax=Rhizophagus irregularis TaxID=588596 RepID=A0A2I1ETJ8_9GLOM|nr:hypothetical protein RhiirA5_417811 [Rhizophagus irregularis]PKC62675.1 hypothetical protein RhiirA1_464818 [Rhizophagus irregularis]PKY25458.1 hypothetical protein RhiirB3_440404 [Rhizophagus irregularis]